MSKLKGLGETEATAKEPVAVNPEGQTAAGVKLAIDAAKEFAAGNDVRRARMKLGAALARAKSLRDPEARRVWVAEVVAARAAILGGEGEEGEKNQIPLSPPFSKGETGGESGAGEGSGAEVSQ